MREKNHVGLFSFSALFEELMRGRTRKALLSSALHQLLPSVVWSPSLDISLRSLPFVVTYSSVFASNQSVRSICFAPCIYRPRRANFITHFKSPRFSSRQLMEPESSILYYATLQGIRPSGCKCLTSRLSKIYQLITDLPSSQGRWTHGSEIGQQQAGEEDQG